MSGIKISTSIEYAKMLRENPSYVPELVSMCGTAMPYVAPDRRMHLLSRLLKALRVNGR